MNPETVLLLVQALSNGLDLIDRLALKGIDNKQQLDAYIKQRDEVRHQLVQVSNTLSGNATQTETAPARPPAANPAETSQPQAGAADASASAQPQG